MNRRYFISALGQYSAVAAAASVATSMASKGRSAAENSVDVLNRYFRSLQKRMENLEDSQRKMTKALVVVTAVSTGIDLTLIL